VLKLRGAPAADLLSSAESFRTAADRCLNGNKSESGIEILIIPGAVCAAMSCELFLKYIVLRETGSPPTGHELDDLLRKCTPDAQAALAQEFSGMADVLQRNRRAFVDARYHHEHDQFTFRQTELLLAADALSAFVRKRFSAPDVSGMDTPLPTNDIRPENI
jgi:HEPN domain-containing protein